MPQRPDNARSNAWPAPRRGGFVYFFILSIAVFVSAIAMAILMAARINGRVLADADDSLQAESLAQSAVEFALQQISADPNWRSDYPTALPAGPLTLGQGTISFTLADEVDGDLNNNAYDPVRISGIGRVHGATRVFSVRCAANVPLDCLKCSAAFGGVVTLSKTQLNGASSLLLCSNASLAADAVNFAAPITLQSPADNATTLAGCTGNSPALSKGTRQLPDPAHVFDYYLAQATAINIGNLPVVNGICMMQLAVLSPASNPYGSTLNAQGIYVLDCQGRTLHIANMRIVGTLIVLNSGAGSGTTDSNFIAPATANFPSLLVRGDFALDSNASNLQDNPNTADPATPRVNYNPPGVPYLGVADSTYTTSYPSRMEGIVYVSGNLTGGKSPVINGVLIAGGTYTQLDGSLTLGGSAAPIVAAPPGFTTHAVTPVAGTWQWDAAR